jgi:hypothetical protein
LDYNLRKPCAKCPFRNDIRPFIHPERARDILEGGASFTCHKTIDYDDNPPYDDNGDLILGRCEDGEQHCAGVLIILEKENSPHQMMRIAERLGMYDRTKLDMTAPVYDSIEECVEAHENPKEPKKEEEAYELQGWEDTNA